MRSLGIMGAALLLLGSALADTKVAGTQTSYSLRKDPVTGTNASMLFVDASGDPTGKTYVAFVCDQGEPFARVYSKVILGRVGDEPSSYFSADGGAVRPLIGVVRDDLESGKPSVMDTTAGSTSQLIRVFMSARKVSIRIEREGFSALTLSFPTAGFAKAWAAIKNCD